jgi:hypothetical protein
VSEDALAAGISEAAGQPLTSRVGTIMGVSPLLVDIGGSALNPAVVGCVSSYIPRVGDTVVLLGQAVEGADSFASSWTIVGANSNVAASLQSHAGLQIMASAQFENAGTFTNVTGLTFAFTKRRAGSLIHGRVAGSGFSSVGANGIEMSARILDAAGSAVAEEVLGSFFFNDALKHHSWSGFDDIPAVPAGVYTVQARFRRYTGAGAVQFDTNDRLSLYFDEV